jgi:hypothetical protein
MPVGVVIVATLGIICTFACIGYIAYVVLEAIRSRQRAQLTSEFQQKLLDRVGSTQELGSFLTSEGGARLLASLSPGLGGGPHQRILRALQAGLVLLVLGLGLFAYTFSRALPIEGEDALAMFATVSTALGIGLLLAAGASYALSRKMGLLDQQGRHETADRLPSA